MDDIRPTLERVRNRLASSPPPFSIERLASARAHRRMGRRLSAIALSIVLTLTTTGLLLRAFHGSAQPISPPPHTAAFHVISRFTYSSTKVGTLSDLVPTSDALWVLHPGGEHQPPAVLKIDSRTGQIISRILLPAPASYMTGDSQALWVLTHKNGGGGSVIHIDPATGQIVGTAQLPAGTYAGPAQFWDGGLWVAANIMSPGLSWEAGTRELLVIDPKSNIVSGSRYAPVCTNYDSRCASARSMQVANGSLWVSARRPGTIVRVDPGSAPRLLTDTGYIGMAIGSGSIWSAVRISDSNVGRTALVRNDENTGARAHNYLVPLTGGSPDPVKIDAAPFATNDGSVWLTARDVGLRRILVARFDVASGKIIDSFAAVKGEVFSGAVLDQTGDAIWVVSPYSIVRLGPV